MSETSDQAGEVPEIVDDAAVADAPVGETEQQFDDDGNPIEDQSLLDDEHDEIEHEGQKYKIPKAVKPLLLMQADYTKKTQDLAETKRALEARSAEIDQQAVRSTESLREHARLVAVEDQIDAYTKVDWATLRAQDPDAYREHWDTYQQLKDTRGNLKEDLTKKDNERAFETQRARAKQLEEATEVLKKDIPSWSPEYAGKLTDFGEAQLGISRAELVQITDPRLIKALHLAYQGAQTTAEKAKAAKLAQAQTVKPAAQVGGGARSAPPVGLDDRLGADEWMRRRNAQLAKRSGR